MPKGSRLTSRAVALKLAITFGLFAYLPSKVEMACAKAR